MLLEPPITVPLGKAAVGLVRESWVFDGKRTPPSSLAVPPAGVRASAHPGREEGVGGSQGLCWCPSRWPDVPELPGRPQLVPLLNGVLKDH